MFCYTLALLQGCAFSFGLRSPTDSPTTSPTSAPVQNYTTVRVELDPDVSSIAGNCTADFAATIATQLSIWYVDAVASYSGSYPAISNPGSFLKVGVFRGEKWSNRMLRQGQYSVAEEGPSSSAEQALPATAGQGQRKLCGITKCNTYCCSPCCISACAAGCDRCRYLQGGRSLSANKWWVMDNDGQDSVAQSMQFAAQRWLNQNDPTRCMGNPWNAKIQVNIF